MLQKEQERLSRPLTEQEQKRALAALEAARLLKAEMLDRRGGEPFADSVAMVRAMREDRTPQLS